MPLNIIDSLKGAISSDFLAKAASKYSESESSIKTVIDKIISVLSEHFANKHSDTGLMNRISNFISELGPNKAVHEVGKQCLDNEHVQDKAAPILNNLFGDKFGQVCDNIAASTNVKKTTVSSLMGTVAAMVASHAVKEGVKHGNGAMGLTNYFKGDRSRCSAHPDSSMQDSSRKAVERDHELSHENMKTNSYAFSDANKDPKRIPEDREETKKKSPWGWVLLLVLAALLGIFTWRGCTNRTEEIADKAVDVIEEGVVKNDSNALVDSGTVDVQEKWSYLGVEKTLDLPNGTTITVPEMGLEAQILNYLKSGKAIDKNIKFNSDKLTFEVNEAVLDEDAKVQCDNIVAIMKAYPKVTIEVGGYASNTGPEQVNKTLSEDRAKAVANYLINEGIDATRLTTKAYGDSNPIANNSTEAGRDENQRVSIKILTK